MANFNEKINSLKESFLFDQDSKYFIERVGSMKRFEQNIHDDLYLRTNTYRLFIQYKITHSAKKMAGRCFLWDNSHGDHMADPGNGIELRSINDASQDDCEGFGNPRFDGMESAILITDRYVFVYGYVKIEVDDISKDKKHVICTVSLRGFIVSIFRIPAEVFDRFFGLKENFPDLYEKVFGKTEGARSVQEENYPIEKAKRSIELYKNSLITNKHRLEQAVYLLQGALKDFDVKWHELDDMLYKLTQKE